MVQVTSSGKLNTTSKRQIATSIKRWGIAYDFNQDRYPGSICIHYHWPPVTSIAKYRFVITPMSTNFSCPVCDSPAARACAQYPFLCGEECKDQQGLALQMYTHHGQTNLIPLEEGLGKVSSIQDPTQYEHLTGKDLAKLLSKKDVYDGQSVSEKVIEEVKGVMEEKVQQIEDAGIGNTLNNLNIQKAEEHWSKGDELYFSSKHKEALEEYQLARQCSPPQPQHVFRIGDCYHQLKDYQQALKHYEERISLGGEGMDLVDSYFNMGVIKADRGENEKAIEYYSKALELKGDYAECYCNRGIAYDDMKKYSEAVKDYTKAIGINDKDAGYYSNRGIVYSNMEKYYEALKDYTKAIEINGGDDRYYNNRGSAYYDMGRWKEAVQDYTRAIQIKPTKKYYNNRAAAYEEMGELVKAKSDRILGKMAPDY